MPPFAAGASFFTKRYSPAPPSPAVAYPVVRARSPSLPLRFTRSVAVPALATDDDPELPCATMGPAACAGVWVLTAATPPIAAAPNPASSMRLLRRAAVSFVSCESISCGALLILWAMLILLAASSPRSGVRLIAGPHHPIDPQSPSAVSERVAQK